MRLRIKSTQDFWTGLFFVVFGATTAALSTQYPLGSAARMGPGYFPLALGILLTGIGAGVVLRSLASAAGEHVGRVDLWLALRLLLAIVIFGLLLNTLGLFATAFATVLAAARAGPEFRLREGLAAAIALSAASWLIFVLILKQPIPVWPAWIA
jgi:Tripartite tricarboxylate transporter TctB family